MKGKILKRTSLYFILMVVFLCTMLLIGNSVSAFSISSPEGYVSMRYNSDILRTISVKNFLDNSPEGLVKDGKIYNKNGESPRDQELLSTGMYFHDKDNKKITVIVKGDISGNGKSSAVDLSIFKKIFTNQLQQEEYCYLKAADMNNDYELSLVDSSLLKMLLVGLPLPEEEPDPNDTTPRLDGNIVITPSTENVSKEVTITVEYPEGRNLDGYTKKISIDGGQTYQDYTGPVKVTGNALVIAAYMNDEGQTLGTVALLIDNIDTIAPEPFEFTATSTTSTITLTILEELIDKMIDYNGNLAETEFTGIKEKLYKLNDGEWQTDATFTGLTADTEYTVYAKVIDYAGNERAATNNGITIRTKTVANPTPNPDNPDDPDTPDPENPNPYEIVVTKDITDVTSRNVTVTFAFRDSASDEEYDIQYQVNGTEGEWTTGNRYVATGNCTIYARIIDSNNQASTEYVTAVVDNIDKLAPLDFTPIVEYDEENDKTIIRANAVDAPADEQNLCSGMGMYTYWRLHESGAGSVGPTSHVAEDCEIHNGNLLEFPGDDPIIGVMVFAYDKAWNETRSSIYYLKDIEIPDDELGVGPFNEGPGNVTIQGAEKSYMNPVIPVGFKAVNTEAATWDSAYLPEDWNEGLVIEDKAGNQFVWVPVPCDEGTSGVDALDAAIVNNRYVLDDPNNTGDFFDEIPEAIANAEVTEETGAYGYKYRTEIVEQVEEYQGFYIARYEAGRKDGKLATQRGLETVNMVTYAEAKNYAESMYRTPYVVSGIPTGIHLDILAEWCEKVYGRTAAETRDKENSYLTSFTFTGRYAEGPDFGSGQVRGPYKYGENITKQAGQEILLTTGIVEQFRMKNIYDILGNVWEYSAERITYTDGNIGHDARFGDYYWNADRSRDHQFSSFAYRTAVPDGDARNEGGFRVVLFLSEGDANVEGFNRTIDGGKANYNNPVIPAGYEPINTPEASWGDGSTPAVDWDKGLVITDELDEDGNSIGNEFVWVPVDGTDVKYETWVDKYLTHTEVGASETAAALVELGETEDSMVSKFNGFYIARYETSRDEAGKIQTKNGASVNTNVSYNDALELLNDFETGRTSYAGVVTGKQWDTTMRWIANTQENGEDLIEVDSSSWGNYNSSLSTTGRRAMKNIYDLAGNAWEITSETYEGKIIYRGGSAYETGTDAPAGYRDAYEKGFKDAATTFRMVLYVNTDGYGEPDVDVKVDTPGPSTDSQTIHFAPEPAGWTKESVKVTMTIAQWSENGGARIAYKVGNAEGEWTTGNEVTVNENTTIYAKLVDANGNTIASLQQYNVTNIDKVLPEPFTPRVTVEGNRVRINFSARDLGSGINQYHFFMDNEVPIREWVEETTNEVVSIELPAGTHQIYVRAVDNAYNNRDSEKVTVTIAGPVSNKLVDVIKPGDYVRADIRYSITRGASSHEATLIEPCLADGGRRTVIERASVGDGVYEYFYQETHTLQFLGKTPTKYNNKYEYYNFTSHNILKYWASDSDNDYLNTLAIGGTNNYDTNEYRFGDYTIVGGNGTQSDPYVLSGKWPYVVIGYGHWQSIGSSPRL